MNVSRRQTEGRLLGKIPGPETERGGKKRGVTLSLAQKVKKLRERKKGRHKVASGKFAERRRRNAKQNYSVGRSTESGDYKHKNTK